MKHNLTTNITFKESYDLTKKIVKVTHNPLCASSDTQLNSSIHPIVSNYAYNRVLKELENERFNTLIKLARVLDDKNMSKAIIGLNYSLSTTN